MVATRRQSGWKTAITSRSRLFGLRRRESRAGPARPPLASLTERIGHGVLDNGTEISPTLARMLACDAAIIPAVLNGHGQPIDLGRERRLFTGAARTAIEIRDGGCVWPGC